MIMIKLDDLMWFDYGPTSTTREKLRTKTFEFLFYHFTQKFHLPSIIFIQILYMFIFSFLSKPLGYYILDKVQIDINTHTQKIVENRNDQFDMVDYTYKAVKQVHVGEVWHKIRVKLYLFIAHSSSSTFMLMEPSESQMLLILAV